MQNPRVSAADLVPAFRLQAGGCRLFASELYAGLMDRALADVMAGGPIAQLLADFEGDPVRGFLPLRLLGAVHARVLDGNAPALAAYYPTAGGVADAEAAWPHFLEIVQQHGDALRSRLGRFPQTNEVSRCAGLLGGFLDAAGRTGLPLRLREIGCSAGLNLQWRRYCYALGSARFGDPASRVRLAPEWRGAPVRLDRAPEIESRAGCDLDPPRLADDAAMRTLESFVWADHPERLALLRAAIETSRTDPPRVDRARAVDWLRDELADPAMGACTVVYHSSVWLYIGADEQQEIRALLQQRGARATGENPLAWLRHEDGEVAGSVEIRLCVWPPGEERLLGYGHPHGRFVEWLGEQPGAR